VPARTLDLLQSEFGTPARLEASRPDHPHLGAWMDWEKAKRRAGVAEFPDLVAGSLVALETGDELLERWRRRAATLLVDEYQDTDRYRGLSPDGTHPLFASRSWHHLSTSACNSDRRISWSIPKRRTKPPSN
jgi:hypothetical protein